MASLVYNLRLAPVASLLAFHSDPKPDSNLSEVPMESETQVEPAKEVVKFTGSKPDEYVPDLDVDVDVLELEKELNEYVKK